MTHGLGGGGRGLSGGLGGGGGIWGMHLHHHSSEGRSDCCVDSICCIINIASILLCIRKMSRYLRIALLWIYVATAVITTGLLISINVLGTNKFQAAPTDMRKVQDQVNNAFCQSLTLNSSDPFEAYTFDREPVVDPSKIEQFNTSYFTSMTGDTNTYWGFYLLKGSKAVVVSSGDELISVFIIKGSSNLQAWIDNKGSCNGCYLASHVTSPTFTYTLDVSQSDDYYFMYYSTSNYVIVVNVNVYITRTLYDVSSATSHCSYRPSDKPCSLDISLSPHMNVVYHNGGNGLHDRIDMWSTCKSRVWMYMIVFALIPALMTAPVTFLFWKYCKDDRSQENLAVDSEDNLPYNKF
ncbi:uncharacterized protein LOC124272592 [Haliotis rubra]|uniref:uncharacterized protein LOC124272592 n=1 Tax=Haliotis rubra TaxID=36100 RepID=UPI001EE5697F|nr:uncharacterized protein LOC124272592 [Haliotis rubra]